MNVLVDTCVWVDHLRKGDAHLAQLLNDGDVICHPFVIGELACGNLKNRSGILDALKELSFALTIELDGYMQFVELNRLYGVGIGFYVISQNLVSCRLTNNHKKTIYRLIINY